MAVTRNVVRIWLQLCMGHLRRAVKRKISVLKNARTCNESEIFKKSILQLVDHHNSWSPLLSGMIKEGR